MNQNQKTPESIEDVKKYVFRRAWTWIIRRSLRFKIASGIIVLIVLFALARLNVFGDRYYRYARPLFPLEIPGIDAKEPVISLMMSFDVEDGTGRRKGKLGGAYYTGDQIYLTFRTSRSCWVTVFCVDAKGIQKVFRDNLSPSLIDATEYALDFELDDTVGNEIYYVVAASEEFSFEEDIKPHLDKVFPEGNSKGPTFSKYDLRLPEKFTQKLIYFNHLSHE